MKPEEKILKILKENNGIITTKLVESNGISRIYLSKMVKNNKIERIKFGVYGIKSYLIDEYYLYQLKHPNAIFSFNTALYFHNMTEKTPEKIDVTVYKGYVDNRKNQNICLHYVKKEILNIGVEEIKSPYGNTVKCYDIERTLCDIVKHQKMFDPEQWGKTMRNYFVHGKVNYSKIIDYANKMGISNLINPFIGISI